MVKSSINLFCIFFTECLCLLHLRYPLWHCFEWLYHNTSSAFQLLSWLAFPAFPWLASHLQVWRQIFDIHTLLCLTFSVHGQYNQGLWHDCNFLSLYDECCPILCTRVPRFFCVFFVFAVFNLEYIHYFPSFSGGTILLHRFLTPSFPVRKPGGSSHLKWQGMLVGKSV